MYKVDVYLRVRRAVMVEGMSIREAAREFGLHRDTVRKMLTYSVPPGVKGGGKVGHRGDGMVDHQHGGSWLARESWRQNQGMADWVLRELVVVRGVWSLGHGALAAAL